MNDLPYIFSIEQGNFLIRLLLAHILADFALQTRKMVLNKRWFSKYMAGHILIVAATNFLLTFSWPATLVIGLSHWVIDGVKAGIQAKGKQHEHTLFLADQFLHLAVILLFWALSFNLCEKFMEVITWPLLDYRLSLLVLAYAFVIWPLAYLLKFALHKMAARNAELSKNGPAAESTESIENAGRLIGQFERVIILTFVLLGQYAAIGFLVTGKSIIRFADRNSQLRGEYVLVGTMMSFGFCIIIGLGTKWLLDIK